MVTGSRFKKHQCVVCGTMKNVTFEPDPFSEEILGDATPVWQCKNCAYESAMDI